MRGFALGPPKGIQYGLWGEIATALLAVVGWAVVFCLVVGVVVGAGHLVVSELLLVLLVAHVPIIHVNRFGLLGVQVLSDKA